MIILDRCAEHEELTAGYKRLASPSHLIALSCDNEDVEKELAGLLLSRNINYKRSNQDIEILYINAKKRESEENNEK